MVFIDEKGKIKYLIGPQPALRGQKEVPGEKVPVIQGNM